MYWPIRLRQLQRLASGHCLLTYEISGYPCSLFYLGIAKFQCVYSGAQGMNLNDPVTPWPREHHIRTWIWITPWPSHVNMSLNDPHVHKHQAYVHTAIIIAMYALLPRISVSSQGWWLFAVNSLNQVYFVPLVVLITETPKIKG